MAMIDPSPPGDSPSAASSRGPSTSLLANFRHELMLHPPFAQMKAVDVDFFLKHAKQQYFAPEEVVLQPADGPVSELLFVRQGAVTGTRGLAQHKGGAFEYQTGDLFPVSAALVSRAVTAVYKSTTDTFILSIPLAAMHSLAGMSPVFADFLQQRTAQFLELSRKAVQAAYSAQALNEQSLEKPLGELLHGGLVTCAPDTPLRVALERMHAQHIGSMLVVNDAGHPVGILTRFDILGRVTLAQASLENPISTVMVQPVQHLTESDSAQDAIVLMSRYGIRHIPVTRDGVAMGMVSERDLFTLQRQSLKSVSAAIRSARDLVSLQATAKDIRRLAHSLLGQGVQARQLTLLISQLNDALTLQLLQMKSLEHGVNLRRLCWLALGSEGRDEQTIATDQDNALILPNDMQARERAAVTAFARDINVALDACGYPLCKGGVMAGEPDCCMTLDAWRQRFAHWIDQGAPADLLNASIFFDFRPLAGDASLANTLRDEVTQRAQGVPRFHKLMAMNALTRNVALNWRGAVDTDAGGHVDLKLQGTGIFVDAARIYSLALGVKATNTRQRLEAVGKELNVAPAEYGAWVTAFEFLQMLRLRIQVSDHTDLDAPNRIALNTLNHIDQRILRESFRVGRKLQQRLQLDYER